MSRQRSSLLAAVLALMAVANVTGGWISEAVVSESWAGFLAAVTVTACLVGAALWCALRLRVDGDGRGSRARTSLPSSDEECV